MSPFALTPMTIALPEPTPSDGGGRPNGLELLPAAMFPEIANEFEIYNNTSVENV
jgi:hypothetical protein